MNPHPNSLQHLTGRTGAGPLTALLLAGGLALCAGAGAGEVVKCTDAQGHVTLTDSSCGAAGVVLFRTTAPAEPAPVVSAEQGYQEPPPPPDSLRMGATRVHLTRADFGPTGSARARFARLARPTVGQELRTDAATLRAAHTSIELSPAELRQVASR
jgi:hypothetical protein